MGIDKPSETIRNIVGIKRNVDIRKELETDLITIDDKLM